MANEIERILKDKIQGDDRLGLLSAQWEFDKQLLSKALQNIVRTFPHFSIHDGSHSETILEQISRVLGKERILMLSATDLWLLLESAYHHDIGMIITADEAREAWISVKFQSFLKDLKKWGETDLVEASSLLLSESIDSTQIDSWPLKTQWSLHIAFAEWFRKEHPERSARFVDAPRNIGIDSPRTLIPKRLFSVLSKVCKAHGQSVEAVMALSAEENGMGTELCHPRFIALMLRLGDLLDLDNGRFCPVTKKAFAPLPDKSAAHDRKHESIRHFLVTPQKIEVHALCHDYDAYFATEEWLHSLRKELEYLSLNWTDIVPLPNFGAPPGIGMIQAELEGYELLEPGKRPRVEVDREAMLEIASGTNLYSDKWTCIRELIQNAIDATLLRAWIADRSGILKLEDAPPNEAGPIGLKKILSKYDIQIDLENLGESKMNPAKLRYRFSIRDQGIGISKEDIRHLLSLGSSEKNRSRRKLIDEMPEWARPSGIFGIGLHSVFPLTDKLIIKTKHARTLEAREIEFESKNGREHITLIKNFEGSEAEAIPVGTTVSFEFEVDRVPSRIEGLSPLVDVFGDFDPICDDQLDVDAVRIRSEVIECVTSAPCPVSFGTQSLVGKTENSPFFFFDKDTGILITLRNDHFLKGMDVTWSVSGSMVSGPIPTYRSNARYRGMKIEHSSSLSLPVPVDFDLYFDTAKKILTISRDGLSPFGRRRRDEKIGSALRNAAGYFIHLEEVAKENMPSLSLLQYLNSEIELDDEWKKQVVHGVKLGKHEKPTLSDLIQKDRIIVAEGHHDHGEMKSASTEKETTADSDDILEIHDSGVGCRLLFEVLYKNYETAKFCGWEKAFPQSRLIPTNGVAIYEFLKATNDENLTRNAFLSVVKIRLSGAGFGVRCRIPCREKYRALKIREKTSIWSKFAQVEHVPYAVVSPLEYGKDDNVTVRNLRKYIEWVDRNKKYDVSLAEIALAAWRFIDDAAEVLEKPGLRDDAKAILREWVDLTNVKPDRS